MGKEHLMEFTQTQNYDLRNALFDWGLSFLSLKYLTFILKHD